MARLKIDLDAASVAIATRVFGELYEKLDSAEDQDVQIDLLINEIKTHCKFFVYGYGFLDSD